MIKIHFIANLNYYIHNEDFTLKKIYSNSLEMTVRHQPTGTKR